MNSIWVWKLFSLEVHRLLMPYIWSICYMWCRTKTSNDLNFYVTWIFLQTWWSWSDLGLCPRDWSTRYCTYRRERPSLLDLLSEFGLISDGWLGSISPLRDWANALECWRSPSLRLVIPGIAVLPGVTHSDSHHLWYEHCRKTPTTTTILQTMQTYALQY